MLASIGEACRVSHQFEVALQVGASDHQARYRGQVLEGDRMRMAVLVVRATADQRDLGHDGRKQCRRGA